MPSVESKLTEEMVVFIMGEDHVCIHEGDIARIDAKQDAFERWQTAQNGTLARIEAKLDTSMDNVKDKFDERLGKINVWMYGLMGSLVLALILLLLNLVMKVK